MFCSPANLVRLGARFASFNSSAPSPPTFAIAFDLDGVMFRGKEVIPSAPKVLRKLTEKGIPWILLTNGGGVTEEDKAEVLSKKLDFPIHHSNVMQSHTPFRHLVPEFKDKLVMVVGSKCAKNIATHYGFKKVINTDDIHAINPSVFPDRKPSVDAVSEVTHQWFNSEKIHAILGFMDPVDYHKDLQICFDVIKNNGTINNIDRPTTTPDHYDNIFGPPIPAYFSGPDFMYVSEWPQPRFGSGIFALSLSKIHKQATGKEFNMISMGKPYRTTYAYAEEMIDRQVQKLNLPPIQTIFMVGDNPETDILGANSFGGRWKSALVRTGVWDHPELTNDRTNPATLVADNVGEAVEKIEEYLS